MVPSCIFNQDELSVLLLAVQKEPGTEAQFQALYSAAPIKSLTRSKQMVEIKNPRVLIFGYTQAVTFLRVMDSSLCDTGGFFDRKVK